MLLLIPIICGTKEIVIVTPALLFLIDWFFIARGSLRKLISRWWIHLPIACAILGSYIYFLKPTFFLKVFGFSSETRNNIGNILTEDPSTPITPYFYIISQFKVLIHYLWIFIWPWSISVDYDWKLSSGIFSPDVLLPLVILMGIALALFVRLRRDRTDWVSFGALWFFICILPRASIVPSTELIADYKTYGASIGLFIAFAYMIAHICADYSNRMLIIMYGSAALFLSAATYARNTVWRTGEEFWENVISNAPRKARAYNNYGVSLSEAHKFEKAIEQFKRAVTLDRFYPDPWVNVAVAYGALKQLDKAIAAIRQAIRMQPYYPENYNNLASFLMQQKNYEEAERMLRRAIELRPHYGKAYFNLGRLYLERNRPKEAWDYFRSACEVGDFDNELGFSAFGMVSSLIGNYEAAAAAYGRAVEINPASLDYRFSLANALFFLKKYEEARFHYEQLVRLRPEDFRYLNNLSEVYKAIGATDKALEFSQRALKLKLNRPTPSQ